MQLSQVEPSSSASLYKVASFILIKTLSFYQAYFHKLPADSGCPQLRTISTELYKKNKKQKKTEEPFLNRQNGSPFKILNLNLKLEYRSKIKSIQTSHLPHLVIRVISFIT